MSFLDLLHEKLSDIDLEIASVEESPTLQHDQKNSYHMFMLDCYESLGRYVSKLKKKAPITNSVQIEYLCLSLPASTMQSLLKFFIELEDPLSIAMGQCESPLLLSSAASSNHSIIPELETLIRRKRDLSMVIERIDKYLATQAPIYKPSHVFIMFGKKRAAFSLERLCKDVMQSSLGHVSSLNKEDSKKNSLVQSLTEEVKKREELMASITDGDLKLVMLIKDYLRNMDLNYIDKSKSYFSEKFTFSDLVRRDKTNKRFTKVEHIRMGGDTGNLYSAELAAEYLLHKMEEMKEDIVLDFETNPHHPTDQAGPNRPSSEPGQEDLLDSPLDCLIPMANNLGRLANFLDDDPLNFTTDSTLLPNSQVNDSKFLTFINIITCENRIISEYLRHLSNGVARQKAFFESRYISPFELTMKFGQEALELMVAYKFTESRLNLAKKLGFKAEETPEKITFYAGSEIPQYEQSSGFFEFSKNSILGHIDQVFGRDQKDGKGEMKLTTLNSFSDILFFLKSCREIRDFITLGLDKRHVKASLHKLLKMVLI